MPAQAQIAAQRSPDAQQGPGGDKKRMTLLQRLAAVGLGRSESDEAEPEPMPAPVGANPNPALPSQPRLVRRKPSAVRRLRARLPRRARSRTIISTFRPSCAGIPKQDNWPVVTNL